jgi:hypothetical protein
VLSYEILMAVTLTEVASYIERYVDQYKNEYARISARIPVVDISPFLYSKLLQCSWLRDGSVIIDQSRVPNKDWWITGGPAICVDSNPSREPRELTMYLQERGIDDNKHGIFRLVWPKPVPNKIWKGTLPPVQERYSTKSGDLEIVVCRFDCSTSDFIKQLTFGAVGSHLFPQQFETADANFWCPAIFRRIGFFNAERKEPRFINYLEVSPHLDAAAWDKRNIFVRVRADVRRDLFWSFLGPESLNFGAIFWRGALEEQLIDRLSVISKAIAHFEDLLEKEHDESVFHKFLWDNPFLLDIYAEAISKPRFQYPEGVSPLGKIYVEPDFILKYANESYKLVELECHHRLRTDPSHRFKRTHPEVASF